MRTFIYILIVLCLPTLVFAQDMLYYPIDIKYSSETENYYVSNWADGDGYISKLDKDGNILETFFEGLHYAGGVFIDGNTLYVLDNLDLNIGGNSLPSYLIGIDLSTGNEILNKEISSDGTYLDFIAMANGNLYITDDQKSKIYKYDIQNNTVSDFLTGLNSPFGICYDNFKNRLLFTANGTGISFLKSVAPSGGNVTTTYYTDAYIKGIVMHPEGEYYCTTWDAYSTQWGDEEVIKVKYDYTWTYVPSYDHNRPFGLCIGYDDVVVVCNWGDHTLSFIEDEVFNVEKRSSISNPYSIYPNPSNGTFSIGFSDRLISNLEITILSMTGQQVYQENISSSNNVNEKKFDLRHLQAGTYLVILKDEKSVSQKKLIIN